MSAMSLLILVVLLLLLAAISIAILLAIVLIYFLYQQSQRQGQKIEALDSVLKFILPYIGRRNSKNIITVSPAASPKTNLQSSPSANNHARLEPPKIEQTIIESAPVSSGGTDLVLTEEFKRGLELLNGDAPCVFVTGKAGTGKSRLLTYFVENTQKSVVLLAPTGMAALRVNGQTIHSFFGFPPRVISEEDIKPSPKRELYRALDTIVIDEISMVRTDMLDAIDLFLRLNGKDSKKPFGGIQMVFFGDLYQLAPVVADEDEGKYLASHYNSSFFFDARVMQQVEMEKLELTKVFRQKDADFINALNAIRVDKANKQVLDYINQQHSPVISNDRNNFVSLVTTNKAADWINSQELAKISSPVFTYVAALEGEFTKKEWRKRPPADLELNLKVGAQVIFIKNDIGKRWLNGSRGRILELGEEHIRAEVIYEGGRVEHEIPRDTWEIIRYKFDFATFKIKSEVVGKFVQYPLRLGWAITIHKSQGATMDRVHIDMGTGAFAAGQAYVALSRCKSLEGMTLERPILLSDIKSDVSVKMFMDTQFPQTVIQQPNLKVPPRANVQNSSHGVRFGEEVLKYGTSDGPREWFEKEDVSMVIPLLGNPDKGVDIRQYRGECGIYIDGKYGWKSNLNDDLSAQSLWHAIQKYADVTIEPLNEYIPIRLQPKARE